MKGSITRIVGTVALAAAAFAAATPAMAGQWSRSGSGIGPYGRTWSSQGSGSCYGGSCASSQRFVGPNGGVTTRSGSTGCSGGTCNHSATVTGPRRGTRTRSSTWTR